MAPEVTMSDQNATFRRHLLSAIGLATVSAVLVGDAPIAGAQEGNAISVQVLLYSGRPDPTYVLEDVVLIDQVRSLVTAATPAAAAAGPVIPSVLGYKGIVVRNPGRAAGLPSRISVYKGRMEVIDGASRILADSGGALEKALLDEAVRRGVIDKTVLDRMKKGQ
jgi:hypothetical protein